jgi:hypothetical protein
MIKSKLYYYYQLVFTDRIEGCKRCLMELVWTDNPMIYFSKFKKIALVKIKKINCSVNLKL